MDSNMAWGGHAHKRIAHPGLETIPPPLPMQISAHFSLSELTRTDTGIENDPGITEGANLVKLANLLLEPIRELLGVPLLVHSAFRCESVNSAVGGARNSAHMDGRACDFHPGNGADIKHAFDKIRESDLPYDKVLMEHHGTSWWIHVQVAKKGNQPRGLAYVATVSPSGTIYTEVKR